MERIIDIAQFIFEEYKKMSRTSIDEMKLHKLLYLSQRECLAITNEPLFSEVLEGWKYGPVSRDVRYSFTEYEILDGSPHISNEALFIVKSVLQQYGFIESWKLSDLTHKEISWKNARKGLKASENGCKEMNIDDIRKDSEKVRPYDSTWDMYIDEFDDVVETMSDD